MANAIRQIPGLQEYLDNLEISGEVVSGSLVTKIMPASLSLDYTPSNFYLFVNGIKQIENQDYQVFPQYKRVDILNRLESSTDLVVEWFYEKGV